jgi:hypothetical protein
MQPAGGITHTVAELLLHEHLTDREFQAAACASSLWSSIVKSNTKLNQRAAINRSRRAAVVRKRSKLERAIRARMEQARVNGTCMQCLDVHEQPRAAPARCSACQLQCDESDAWCGETTCDEIEVEPVDLVGCSGGAEYSDFCRLVDTAISLGSCEAKHVKWLLQAQEYAYG